VVLNFGVSHDWERLPQDMEIELSHRISSLAALVAILISLWAS
jgi:hypothetical protein